MVSLCAFRDDWGLHKRDGSFYGSVYPQSGGSFLEGRVASNGQAVKKSGIRERLDPGRRLSGGKDILILGSGILALTGETAGKTFSGGGRSCGDRDKTDNQTGRKTSRMKVSKEGDLEKEGGAANGASHLEIRRAALLAHNGIRSHRNDLVKRRRTLFKKEGGAYLPRTARMLKISS